MKRKNIRFGVDEDGINLVLHYGKKSIVLNDYEVSELSLSILKQRIKASRGNLLKAIENGKLDANESMSAIYTNAEIETYINEKKYICCLSLVYNVPESLAEIIDKSRAKGE